jgi:hypothetical protein
MSSKGGGEDGMVSGRKGQLQSKRDWAGEIRVLLTVYP